MYWKDFEFFLISYLRNKKWEGLHQSYLTGTWKDF
jgi:hypothetical protein